MRKTDKGASRLHDIYRKRQLKTFNDLVNNRRSSVETVNRMLKIVSPATLASER